MKHARYKQDVEMLTTTRNNDNDGGDDDDDKTQKEVERKHPHRQANASEEKKNRLHAGGVFWGSRPHW